MIMMLSVSESGCQHGEVTRGTFEAGLVALIQAHHPQPPTGLAEEVRLGVAAMIEAAIRSAGEDSLRPEVIYAIRSSKLAARLLPAEVYRDPSKRSVIKSAIRTLVREHLTPQDSTATDASAD